MIKLIAPANGACVVLLRDKHLEYIAHPIADPEESKKIDWLNLKATGGDLSYPLPVTFKYEPAVDGEVILKRTGGETRVIKAVSGVAEVTNLYIGAEYQWYVKAGWMTSDVFTFKTDARTPRLLYVDGISNVRDIGGFYTSDRQARVRQGLVYRTSELDTHVQITEDGKRVMLEELRVRTDIDIRGVNGEARCPVLDEARVRWINYPMAAYEEIFTPEQMELYRQSFELLADRGAYPVFIHCWGGIDRTGCWLYILGGMLGVGADDLGLDYEMSSFSRWNRRSRNHPQFLGFLQKLHSYGNSVKEACEGFLRACGVSDATMETVRNILLEETD